MRILTSTSIRAMMAQETDEIFVMLATLTHVSFPQPIRVCSDLTPVISNSRYFFGWRFDIQFPSDINNELPRAQAVIDNINPAIGDAIQTMANQATSPSTGGNTLKVTIEFVRLSDPDTIEAIWNDLTLRTVKVDDVSVTGTLTYEDILNEPLAAKITPSTVPGVF